VISFELSALSAHHRLDVLYPGLAMNLSKIKIKPLQYNKGARKKNE